MKQGYRITWTGPRAGSADTDMLESAKFLASLLEAYACWCTISEIVTSNEHLIRVYSTGKKRHEG